MNNHPFTPAQDPPPPRFAVKAGVSSEQLLEVQGMNLERYAALGHLLEPFGGQPQRVEGDRIVYRVHGSADQLRTQLSLAKLQEVPAGEAPAQQPPWGWVFCFFFICLAYKK